MIEIKIPSPGESITEVQISRWLKNSGEFVTKDEELLEVESDKATLTVVADESGLLTITVPEGELVAVGSIVATIDPSQQGAAPTTPKATPVVQEAPKVAPTPTVETKATASTATTTYATGHASVAAQKLIEEHQVPKTAITATGKDGRITKGDVLETLAKGFSTKEASTTPSREQKAEKMSMLRKKIAQRLVSVKQETAMLTTFNEVDMTGIMEIRKTYKDTFKEQHGVGLGFMSFFTKAVTQALELYPAVNAQINGDEIIYHNYADIGIAVSAPKGLMVPVLRNAEHLSLAQIESEIGKLAKKARDGKLSIDEMQGGTFTITNGGVFGSMMSTPIINPPQSAILGMHNIVERPMAVNGKVEIRPIMYVALSYDHRIIDGRESVGFLVTVKKLLENPSLMLFNGTDPQKVLLGLQ